MKKLTVNLDALVIVMLVLVASLGMNAWQLHNIREVMQKYVDAEWELGNIRASAAVDRGPTTDCNPGSPPAAP